MFLELAENISSLFNIDQSLISLIFLTIFFVSLFYPLLFLIRLPQRLRAEQSIKNNLNRLRKNKVLEEKNLVSLEKAYDTLNIEADKVIEERGKRVFYLTAISQNGALDIILVLFYQLKVILEVAKIYLQRPSVRELIYLYSNIGSSLFLSGQIEEAEYLDSVEPIISNVLGSTITLVPGTSIIVNSVISGSSNAYLTLRLGLLTKQYCQYENFEVKETRRNVSIQAGTMLFKISREGTLMLLNKFGSSIGDKVGSKFSDFSNKIKNALKKQEDVK